MVQSQTDWLLAKACLRTSQPILGGAVGGILLNNNKKKNFFFRGVKEVFKETNLLQGSTIPLRRKRRKAAVEVGLVLIERRKEVRR